MNLVGYAVEEAKLSIKFSIPHRLCWFCAGGTVIDIDRIIRSKTLAEITSQIRLADYMLDCEPNENVELYWLEYRSDYQLALDIAVWSNEGKVLIPKSKQQWFGDILSFRILQALRKTDDLDTTLQEHLKSHWDMVKAKRNDKDPF